jgi:anaerobic ribonucleoside-triphosphate reductase activating protein
MNIARILYPVKVLGPGGRVGIWFCGCPHRCKGCSNPELWQERPEYEITLQNLQKIIGAIAAKYNIDGFTISGGDPMAQGEELAELIKYLKTINGDILIYTGYKYEELCRQGLDCIDYILSSVAVLIDGLYIEALNNNSVLRGSKNQNIFILSAAYKSKYENYLKTAHNKIQNFTTTNGVVSVGIHRKNFLSELELKLDKGGKDNV